MTRLIMDSIVFLAVLSLIAACVWQGMPTFVDHCTQCGERLEDADDAHAHFIVCDGEKGGGPW